VTLDVYKATRNRPGCIRIRDLLVKVRSLLFGSLITFIYSTH
jgi:hypothetical protein